MPLAFFKLSMYLHNMYYDISMVMILPGRQRGSAGRRSPVNAAICSNVIISGTLLKVAQLGWGIVYTVEPICFVQKRFSLFCQACYS